MSRYGSGLQSVSSNGVGRTSPDGRPELAILGSEVVHERADAARNRRRVIAAAERLFAERGVGRVTMDDVAAAAGVGKGTVYRRFVDKGGLAVALLDEREKELQAAILSGPAPLGPGAEPAQRLAAFLEAYLAYLVRQLDLVMMSETAALGARVRTGAHSFWHTHCRLLLEATHAPNPPMTADVLLAALSAEQVHHWLIDDHRAVNQLAAYFTTLVHTLTSTRHG